VNRHNEIHEFPPTVHLSNTHLFSAGSSDDPGQPSTIITTQTV
jgi:hypothetical protein